MASVCTRFTEWVKSPFSAVVTFQKQFIGDVTEKVKHQKEKLDRRIREQQQRAIELKLDELEEKYLCCVCHRSGEAREEEEHVYETFSMINVPPTQRIVDAVEEANEYNYEEQEEEESEQEGQEHIKSSHNLPERENIITAATNLYDSESYGIEYDNRAHAQNAKSNKHFDRPPIISTTTTTTTSTTLLSKHTRRTKEQLAHDEKHEEEVYLNVNAPLQDKLSEKMKNHAITSSEEPSHATLQKYESSNENNINSRQVATNFSTHHINDASSQVIDTSTVSRRDVQHMLFKIRHAILNKEAHVKRKAVAIHRDKGLMKIDEAEIDLFSLFFQRPVHGYLCASCYTSARRRLDTLTRQVQLILFKAAHPLLRKVSHDEMNEELRRGRATLPALLAGPQSETFAYDGVLQSSEELVHQGRPEWEQEQQEQERELYSSSESSTQKHYNTEHLFTSDAALQRVDNTLKGNNVNTTNPKTYSRDQHNKNENNNNNNNDDNDVRINDDVQVNLNTSHNSSWTGDCNDEMSSEECSLPMGQLTDEVIALLRSYVKCGVCQRRSSCFFVRRSVLFICQFCCARDRFYRDHAICINDELIPLDCVHLLTDLCQYYSQIHREQQVVKGERSLNKFEHGQSKLNQPAPTSLFGHVNEHNLFECLQPMSSNTSVSIVPVYDETTLNVSDPRKVVSQTSVKLFAGRKLEPCNTAHIDLFASHKQADEQNLLIKENEQKAQVHTSSALNNRNDYNNNRSSNSSSSSNNITNGTRTGKTKNSQTLDELFNQSEHYEQEHE